MTPEWAELVEDAGLLIERFQVALRTGHGAVVEAPLAPGGPKPEITENCSRSWNGTKPAPALFLARLALRFGNFAVSLCRLGMVCGNLATHNSPAIQDWLACHRRFCLHPDRASWIDQVER